ncbi:MAG: UDP-N-acetylmuramoyl-tripeptide--D-alanyl-D-alanine ligase, partial [Candidatus Tectomicrobia bacterium]|nr:UDP-N-acetylmuramoyl-tripeptide--D-alanyl-D-alanine ligase [Candidatus Tectomicrobia bacterium]
PSIGIHTSVGLQHLERFKDIGTIAKAKYELIEALPQDGVAIFNNDSEICRGLAGQTPLKVIRYGTTAMGGVHLLAEEIREGSFGLEFLVKDLIRGESALFRTILLGRHNASNILAATAAALKCGMTLSEIGEGVSRLEPIPHRLQVTKGSGGVTVIDDAYNSNPIGAQMALETLGKFEHGAKVLVTPGMIELGQEEYNQNKQFGVKAAAVCDSVILVGPKRTIPIQDGLKEGGFPGERMVVVKSLREATERLKEVVKPGDVVLFENDLPDNYNEE